MSNTIHDVLSYGPIVFSDEETGVLITVNSAYLNWWNAGRDEGTYTNSDCRGIDSENGLYSLTVSAAMDQAKEWFEEEMHGEDDSEDEDEDDYEFGDETSARGRDLERERFSAD